MSSPAQTIRDNRDLYEEQLKDGLSGFVETDTGSFLATTGLKAKAVVFTLDDSNQVISVDIRHETV